eukprot:TRINITY_DN11281_c0_g1_i1.p1 TRINITY_DN11281_c0_g1~~TRINITY_DN11281_c0_g1_i1.p1  ORF type:complete len:463 (-),score=84.53 TRINITY_DN11281_c0_g1_i1:28-1416(-)
MYQSTSYPNPLYKTTTKPPQTYPAGYVGTTQPIHPNSIRPTPASEDYVDFAIVLNNVCNMPFESKERELAGMYGLDIVDITWEDNARNIGSSWGPCISDMTLNVDDRNLPVIRSPNYEDLTWDVPMDNIPLLVGNETGRGLTRVSLTEYLKNFRNYLHNPSSWAGSDVSLHAFRDSHVVMSSQACFLPIPVLGGDVPFNVSLFNYQSSARNPAVLVIVSNSRGTSAQIIDSSSSQKLYFNDNGKKCSFLGQRLSQHRVETGRENNGAPMTTEEKEKNMILIIQIPLIQTMSKMRLRGCNRARKMEVDVEDAIINIGHSEGVFTECKNHKIERNPDYPVRVTLQYYKATSNGAIDDNIMSQIFDQLHESRNFATSMGSLVLSHTNRPTQPILQKDIQAAPWWSTFWMTYQQTFPQYTEYQAKRKVFQNGRYLHSPLNQCKESVLDLLLEEAAPPKPQPWNFFG